MSELATDRTNSKASSQRTTLLLNPSNFPATFLEKNLATTGYFSAGRQRTGQPSVKRIACQRRENGTLVDVVVEILGNGRDLLPNSLDLKLHLAWMSVFRRDCQRARRLLESHEFASTQLLRELAWTSDSGVHYRDVERFVRVSATTSIVSTQAVFLKRARRYVSECFRVFDRALTAGQLFEDGRTVDRNHVWLSSWFLENLEQNYTVGIDLERFQKLTRAPAQLLAAMLPFWTYVARHDGAFQKRYRDLGALLGIRCYEHRSKAIEKLGPSLDELQRLDYIVAWQFERTRDDDFKVVLRVRPRPVAVPAAVQAFPPAARPTPQGPQGQRDHPDVTAQLTERGVSRLAARRILAEVGDAPAVARQIAHFDRVVTSARGASLRNPAGFLVSLIRSGEGPDPREPEASQRVRPEPAAMHHYQILQAYNRYVADAVAAHLEALAPDELEGLIEEHRVWLQQEEPSCHRWPLEQQQAGARCRLEQHLARTLPVRRLHEFMAEHDASARDDAEAVL